MAVKILISGLANAGKTSLTKDLPETLVISHDGKAYPYKTPHGTIATFGSTDEFIDFVSQKVEAYNNKFGKFPDTIVVDSASRVFDTLYDSCNTKYTGFAIYQQLDKEVKKLSDFLENDIVGNGVNLVIISHALFDADTNQYNLVGKGSFAKLGKVICLVV
jgi:GTPase SAR1 family protein